MVTGDEFSFCPRCQTEKPAVTATAVRDAHGRTRTVCLDCAMDLGAKEDEWRYAKSREHRETPRQRCVREAREYDTEIDNWSRQFALPFGKKKRSTKKRNTITEEH